MAFLAIIAPDRNRDKVRWIAANRDEHRLWRGRCTHPRHTGEAQAGNRHDRQRPTAPPIRSHC
ncbi:MAG: hypothetical protein BVN33_01440 [Proteobacteria bacterium ST_bin13]|nr:MAG: hypothetical protein BVN33_01440 [Proteobacteria bacterium ST_bin13]